MPRKQDGSRKSDIADAILKIAGREGIGALTMERLARELGVTSGALFRHFPTRASMLNEAAHLAATRLEATFPPVSLPPLERLRQFLVARSKLAAEHGGIPQLVFSEQFGKALPPKGSRAVREAVLRTRDFVVEALREAAAQGEVRRDIPAPELALTVIGTVFARSLFAAFDGGEGKPPQEPQARWTSLVRLLGAPPSASPSSPGRPSPTATPSTAPS
jgi:TetR/AcrR family transcriptional regulator